MDCSTQKSFSYPQAAGQLPHLSAMTRHHLPVPAQRLCSFVLAVARPPRVTVRTRPPVSESLSV